MNGYRHDARPPHSLRFRNDIWHDIQDRAAAERSDATTLVTEAIEAMLGYARCYRCGRAVLVQFGNLAGMTLREAVVKGTERVARQKCRDHAPVTIGRDRKEVAARSDLAATVEDLRGEVEEIRERITPAATTGPVPFKAPAATR